MRLTSIVFGLLIFLGSIIAAFAVEIDVQRLEDQKIYRCPSCQRPIRSGHIGQTAEPTIVEALKTGLDERQIRYTEAKGKDPFRLHVLIYRFQQRQGSNIAVDKPASIGLHAHLYKGNVLVKTVIFDETQQPLSENVLDVSTFIKRGGKWITVDKLAREGIEKVLDDLQKELEGSK